MSDGENPGLRIEIREPGGGAPEPVGLLVLDGDAIAAVAVAMPAVAAVLGGRRIGGAAPAGGRRLSRVTFHP